MEPNLPKTRAISPAFTPSLHMEEKDESSLTRFFTQYALFLTLQYPFQVRLQHVCVWSRAYSVCGMLRWIHSPDTVMLRCTVLLATLRAILVSSWYVLRWDLAFSGTLYVACAGPASPHRQSRHCQVVMPQHVERSCARLSELCPSRMHFWIPLLKSCH